MKIKIKKVDDRAVVPTYAHKDDAGMDLYVFESVSIPPGYRSVVGTGIAMHIPERYVGLIWDKSGISTKLGLKVLGGVIDAGYRGEVRIGLINLGKEPIHLKAGQKVAQMLIQKIESPTLVEVDELDETARGEGSFGSTGH